MKYKIEELISREFKINSHNKIYKIDKFKDNEYVIITSYGYEVYYHKNAIIKNFKNGDWKLIPIKTQFEHLEEIEVSDFEKFIGFKSNGRIVS